MSVRERMTVAAAVAVLLASTALVPLFEGHGWVPRVLGAVLTVAGVGLVCRRTGVPRPVQPLLSLAALGLYLCEAFARPSLRLGLVPTGRTLTALAGLVHAGRTDIAGYGPPVPTHPGLLLLSTAGIGAVALAVDLLAVLLERAAVAGLPLLALLAVPSGVLPGGLGWLPFSLGAAGWLGLLLVEGGERVGRWGAPTASGRAVPRSDSSLGRVGRQIGAAALGFAVVVPALVPGLDARLFSGNGSGSGAGSGGPRSTTTYNPITRLGEELSQPNRTRLLTYTTNDPQPDYLRMTTLDRYDGSGWSASTLVADRQRSRVQDGVPPGAGETGPHQDLVTTVTIDRLDVRWLPVPFGTTRVDVKGTWLWDGPSTTAFSSDRATSNLGRPYVVTASRPLPAVDALQASTAVDPAVAAVYGTPLTVSPYVEQTTRAITQGAVTPYERAVAVQAWFRAPASSFVYDLQPSTAPPGGDALEAFLRGRHGFCEQYATAMAVMLRTAGLPSRVAVGFTPGTQDPQTDRWTVTTAEAHAWPEAWFAGVGWVRFEPTPAQSTAVVPAYSVAPVGGVGARSDSGVPATAPRVAGPSPRQLGDQAPAGRGAGGTVVGTAPARRPVSGTSLLWTVVPIGLLLLLVSPALLSGVRRRRRWARPDALAAWEQLEEDAVDVGHHWDRTQSPRPAAIRLARGRRLPPPACEALDRVAAAAERARYGPAGPHAAGTLRADTAMVRAALLDGCASSHRWRARLLPVSTLRWAGRAGGTALAQVRNRRHAVRNRAGRGIRRG